MSNTERKKTQFNEEWPDLPKTENWSQEIEDHYNNIQENYADIMHALEEASKGYPSAQDDMSCKDIFDPRNRNAFLVAYGTFINKKIA